MSLSYNNRDWMAASTNVTKARKRLAQLKPVLEKECVPPQTAALFYQAAVRSVLFYGSETFVWDKAMESKVATFEKKALRVLARQTIRYDEVQQAWIYPATEPLWKQVKMVATKESLGRRQIYMRRYAVEETAWPIVMAWRSEGSFTTRSTWWDQTIQQQ